MATSSQVGSQPDSDRRCSFSASLSCVVSVRQSGGARLTCGARYNASTSHPGMARLRSITKMWGWDWLASFSSLPLINQRKEGRKSWCMMSFATGVPRQARSKPAATPTRLRMRMRKTFAAATTRMRGAARRSGPVLFLCFETSKVPG